MPLHAFVRTVRGQHRLLQRLGRCLAWAQGMSQTNDSYSIDSYHRFMSKR